MRHRMRRAVRLQPLEGLKATDKTVSVHPMIKRLVKMSMLQARHACLRHIGAGTGATSAPGLPPHRRRDCRHIGAGTAPAVLRSIGCCCSAVRSECAQRT
jgi:hypothetical protein